MPTMHRVKFINIGYPEAIFDGLILNCRSITYNYALTGANTYVLAENGLGKSSMIGLIFALLRPNAREFLSGEGQKKRKLIDYIPKEGTSHVLVEWIKDSARDARFKGFLLTGMAIERKEGKNLDIVFYSSEYTQNYDENDVTFNNFRFSNEQNEYLKTHEIKQILRRKKSEKAQKITIIDQKGEWEEYLKSYYIEPELYRVQTKMNEREAAQTSIMNFGNKFEFIDRIFDLITPFDNPEQENNQLEAVKKNFEEFKQLPLYKEQLEFFQKAISFFESGEELQRKHEDIYQKLESFFVLWTDLSKKTESFLNYLNTRKDIQIDQKENTKKKAQNTKAEIEEIDNKVPIFQEKYFTKLIDVKNKDHNDLEQDISILRLKGNMFNSFPLLREINICQSRINNLIQMEQDKLTPLQERFEQAAYNFGIELVRLRNSIQTQSSENKNKVDNLRHENDTAIGKKSENETNLEHFKKQKEEFEQKLKVILKIEEDLKNRKILFDYETPNESIQRITKMIDKENEDIEIISKSIKHLEEIINQLNDKVKKSEIDSGFLTHELDEIKDNITAIQELWFKITQTKYYKLYIDSESVGTSDPNYNLISEVEIEKWNFELNDLQLSINSLEINKKKVEEQLQYYENQNNFPPSPEIFRLINKLRNEGLNAVHGWAYLNENYQSNPDWVKNWAEKAPILLEGIVIIQDNFKDLRLRLKKLAPEYLEGPVYISHASLFADPPSDKIDKDRILLLGESLAWRYNTDMRESFASKLKDQYEEIDNEIRLNNDSYQLLSEFVKLSQKFLNKFPESSYLDLTAKEHNLQEKLRNAQELQVQTKSEMQDWVYKLDEHTIKCDELQTQIKNLQKVKEELIAFAKDWENKLEWEAKYKNIEKEMHQVKATIDGQERQLEGIKIEISGLEENRGIIEWKLNDLLHTFEKLPEKIQERCNNDYTYLETNEIPHDIFEILKIKFEEVKFQLEQDPEFKELHNKIRQSGDEFEDKNKKLKLRLKQKKISRTQLESFEKEYELFSDVEISDEEDKIREELEKSIKKEDPLNREIKEIQSKLDAIKTTVKKISIIQAKVEFEIPDDISELDSEINAMIKERSELNSNLSKLTDDCNKITNEIDKLSGLSNHGKTLAEANTINLSQIKSWCEASFPTDEYQDHLSLEIDDSIQKIEDTFNEIKGINGDLSNQTTIILQEWNKLNQQMDDYVRNLQKFATLQDTSKIQNDPVVQFLAHFPKENIRNITQLKAEIEVRVERLSETIETNKKYLNIIVEIFTGNVMDFLRRVHEIQLTKIPVPNNPALNDKQIIKIDLGLNLKKPEDLNYLTNQIQVFFEKLSHHEKFPKELNSLEILQKKIVQECLRPKLKSIRFLIPRRNEDAPQYKNLEDALISSGGQTATIAILLYCLIAHYRMKQIYAKLGVHSRFNIPSSTFIMDNPFGKVNRQDLVELQVALARSLNIQLFVFSGHEEFDIINQFETTIALRSYPYEGRIYVEVDENNPLNQVKGDSITQTKVMKLTSYFKVNSNDNGGIPEEIQDAGTENSQKSKPE